MHPKDQTQVFRLGKKYLYLLSHLASPSSLLIHFSNSMSSAASCCLPAFQRCISHVIQCQITCFCAVLRTSINSLSKNLFSISLHYSHSMGISFAFIVRHSKPSANSFSTFVLMRTFCTQLAICSLFNKTHS